MTQAELDRRIIVFIIGAFVLMFLVIGFRNEKCACENETVFQTDTIYRTQLRIDTLIRTQLKEKRIYEKDIDTIYLLTPADLSREYTKSIGYLDSLNKAGFFFEH
jgi:hypothetical protein